MNRNRQSSLLEHASPPRTSMLVMVLTLMLATFLTYPREGTARANFSNKTISTKVVRVIDGDTFELASGDNVRLLHINTPEKGEVGAAQATALCRELAENKTVELRFDKVFEDHYGRLLAEVYTEGKSINQSLVEAGLAHVFIIPPVPAKARKRLVKAQVDARERRVGIWKEDPRYAGSFHITSFKHNAPGDDRENLNGEYVRIANIGSESANLEGYRIENKRGDGISLPAIRIPVGRTIKIRVGTGKSQLKPGKGQQYHYMKRTHPLWSNKGDIAVLKRPDGAIEDKVPSKDSRFK